MFAAQALAEEFTTHVRGCRSGIVACSARTAVESWFQVELACMMLSSSRCESVEFGYDYPNRGKADLAATCENGVVVIEIKCFVSGADSNKLDKWPQQLGRLQQLIVAGRASQGVAVSTFYGYGADKVSRLVRQFHPSPWDASTPSMFFDQAKLQLVVATLSQRTSSVHEV